MARKVTANVYMTFDGRGDFPVYPGSDYSTGEPDDFFSELWISRYDDVDTIIMGRRSFEGHQKVHSEVNRKPTDPKFMFEYSRFLDRSKKILLSHRVKSTTWQNSRIMKGDLSKIISRLKREKGKNIIIEGGPALVKEAIKRGLLDEYRILMQPVILGRGPNYWGAMPKQRNMRLKSVKTMRYGELVLRYEAVR